jgi:hypothetical protein
MGLGEVCKLVAEYLGRKGPAWYEHKRRPLSTILVVKLDPRFHFEI